MKTPDAKLCHFIENENKTADVTLAIDDCKLFNAHKKKNAENISVT